MVIMTSENILDESKADAVLRHGNMKHVVWTTFDGKVISSESCHGESSVLLWNDHDSWAEDIRSRFGDDMLEIDCSDPNIRDLIEVEEGRQ